MFSLDKYDFTHLHVHSNYSILDGEIRLTDLFKQCRKYGMSCAAITDHGTILGALDFYAKAIKAGIKPIIGCEINIISNRRVSKGEDRPPQEKIHHLVLLAMNQKGYRNLIQLSSISCEDAGNNLPTIYYPILEKHNSGLIVLTGCNHGEIPNLILQNSIEKARSRAQYLKMVFGDRLYLELQENGTKGQKKVNEWLLRFSRELDIPVVATNNCHYLMKEDAYAHKVLRCIKEKKKISELNHLGCTSGELYFKSADEMVALFSDHPEAIRNTRVIADRCTLEMKFDKTFFPSFPLPKDRNEASVLKMLIRDGLKKHLLKLFGQEFSADSRAHKYQNRIEQELSTIIHTGYAGYFLIVQDFVAWAKKQQIPVGPGRGSGAGSLVAFCLGITEVDPVQHDLLFERFLNSEREAPPDFDIDLCRERQPEVIQYITEKYGGKQHVAHLTTIGSMKARGVLRDVGRVLGIQLGTINSIVQNFPGDNKATLKEILVQSTRIQEIARSSPKNQRLFSIATKLEGLPRYKSIHPAGLVVSSVSLTNHIPICIDKNGHATSQFDMHSTEMAGFIKFDLLRLKTLTVINLAIKLIKEDCGVQLDLKKIAPNDPKTYSLLQQGNTTGVFQLEGSGMRKLLNQVRPTCFEDLVVVLALYRPGPLAGGMKSRYLKARQGKMITHVLPQVKPILAVTHGIILYQEQVMQIAHVVASFTMAEADILRRAMTKKDTKLMVAQKKKFIAGALKNNIPEVKAKGLFDQMAMFAKYGFNKSHSTAYALLSYRTAYLKTHYPAQFMEAVVACDQNNKGKHKIYKQASHSIKSSDNKN